MSKTIIKNRKSILRRMGETFDGLTDNEVTEKLVWLILSLKRKGHTFIEMSIMFGYTERYIYTLMKSEGLNRAKGGKVYTKHYVDYNGKNIPLLEACKIVGVSYDTIIGRVRRHVDDSIQEAFDRVLSWKS